MPSGPKEHRANKQQLVDEKRQMLMEKLRENEARKEEEEREKAEADDWSDDSKASKRREEQLSRQEKEAEASRKRFAAKAEWAREFGEVPPEPVYNSRGGLGYSNPASNPEAELQGDTNSQRPAIDEPNPQTVADVERMARHTEYHMRSSKTVEYRPPKKDRDWSRTEKGAHHEDE
jgi:hypothetical protein